VSKTIIALKKGECYCWGSNEAQKYATQIIIADEEQHHYPREYDEYTSGRIIG
jgi:hypothetical protein